MRSTNVVYSPSSIEEIGEIFKHLSQDTYSALKEKHKYTRKKIIASWLYRFDGRCAERVGNIALSMQLKKIKHCN